MRLEGAKSKWCYNDEENILKFRIRKGWKWDLVKWNIKKRNQNWECTEVLGNTWECNLGHDKKELKMFLKENLHKEYSCLSQSPIAGFFFFFAKKDKELHSCQDYWYLNKRTVKNAYSLPLISELIDKLVHAIIFIKLNLWSSYNNVCIRDED